MCCKIKDHQFSYPVDLSLPFFYICFSHFCSPCSFGIRKPICGVGGFWWTFNIASIIHRISLCQLLQFIDHDLHIHHKSCSAKLHIYHIYLWYVLCNCWWDTKSSKAFSCGDLSFLFFSFFLQIKFEKENAWSSLTCFSSPACLGGREGRNDFLCSLYLYLVLGCSWGNSMSILIGQWRIW